MEGSEGQLKGSEGQLEGSEGQPDGSEGQPGEEWTDGRTVGISSHSTGLSSLPKNSGSLLYLNLTPSVLIS